MDALAASHGAAASPRRPPRRDPPAPPAGSNLPAQPRRRRRLPPPIPRVPRDASRVRLLQQPAGTSPLRTHRRRLRGLRRCHEDWWALDCRHGLALLENRRTSKLLVWDLATGDACYLTVPPAPDCGGVFNAAVLRAAGHGDCHSRCPFLVVYLCSPSNYMACACVYSETGIWSEITSIAMPYLAVDAKPTALVGNTLYWLLDNSSIFEFDLDNHRLALTETIPYDALASYEGEIIIMPTEDGLLGLAGVEGFNLHLWSMVKSIDGVVTTWTRQRVIDLNKIIAPEVLATCTVGVEPIGFAEDAGVIFIYVHPSVYMIHLKSMQTEEVSEKGTFGSIFPYASFYSPGITICGGDDQAELLNRT